MSFLLIFFYFLILSSAVFMVLSLNPINSVLFSISVFFNTAMIFILLNLDFLGLLFLMIYVGAIAVLFLFVVMMLNIKRVEQNIHFYIIIGALVFVSYSMQFTFFLFYDFFIYMPSLFHMDKDYFSFYQMNFIDDSLRFMAIKKIGFLLYYEYVFFLIFTALILFIAMLGAIYLTNEKQGYSMKSQYNQLARNHYIINTIIY